jgi:hypothetical protein
MMKVGVDENVSHGGSCGDYLNTSRSIAARKAEALARMDATFPPMLEIRIGIPNIPIDDWDNNMTEEIAEWAAESARRLINQKIVEHRAANPQVPPASTEAEAELERLRADRAVLVRRIDYLGELVTKRNHENVALLDRIENLTAIIEQLGEQR